MYTVCPVCGKQFHLYAEHIAAASGQVRCGFCRQQFNVLDRLYDKPLSDEKISTITRQDSDPVQKPEIEPQFTVSGAETAANETGARLSVEQIRARILQHQTQHIEPEINIAPDVKTKAESMPVSNAEKRDESYYQFPTIEELLLQTPAKRNRVAIFLWTLACMLGLITLILQIAWFNRDRLLAENPQLKPYVKQICRKLNCRLIRHRDARAITLVNRDVRLHPDYQDTLLVNATMKNELGVRQPYPRVQLTLFDTAGVLLGHREFTPDDYLDDSIEIDRGMPVDSPIHFVLEVGGPTADAVSFEFRFL